MAVTFVLGRAGAGKTRYCLDALTRALEDPVDARPLLFLVPEQAGLQMERALALRVRRRGFCRAMVLGFSRLAQRVLSETSGEPHIISASARSMALRAAAARMGASLRFFGSLARTQGFYDQLGRLIESFLAERLTPEDLRQGARAVNDGVAKRKLAELARLYREYLDWLGEDRLDPARRGERLRAQLAQAAWLDGAAIWVDGFAGFTGQEYATLAALARRASEMTITLLADPASAAVQSPRAAPDPLGLFSRTEQTYQHLRALLEAEGIPCDTPVLLHPSPLPRFREQPALAELEAGLAAPILTDRPASLAQPLGSADVRLLECSSHRDELRSAARWIRQSVLDAGGRLRFRDFAVIARDLEPFTPLVAEVFGEYELPYFLDRRRSMRAHPLSRLLEALLEALASDCSLRSMTRLLRSGLTPLSPQQAETLENFIVASELSGYTAWASASAADDQDERRYGCGQIADAIRPLWTIREADAAPPAASWAAALSDILEGLGARRRLEQWMTYAGERRAWEEAEVHRLAWEAVAGLLDDLHDVLGETKLSVNDVRGIVGSALRNQTLGLAPPTVDQVLVSAIERSRHPDVKCVWVVGFNEGLFPARPPEDELLTADEREAARTAGLPLPAGRREDVFAERLLAYIALTRPSEQLVISYAAATDEGEPLEPSPLLADVRRALPGLRVERPEAGATPACLGEAARRYLHVQRSGAAADLTARYAALQRALSKHAMLSSLWEQSLRGLKYEVKPEQIPPRLGLPPDVAWRGSPSELETQLDCPFKHFASRRLRLDTARGPRPLAWTLGDAAHEILAEVTRRAMQRRGGVRGLPDSAWEALLDEVLKGRAAQAENETRARAFAAESLRAFLRELVLVHAERWRRGEFEPLGCEQRFGAAEGDAWPPLTIMLEDGRRAEVCGSIDRVDQCNVDGQSWLLVYDYKTRCNSARCCFLTGARLQVFCYLAAALQAQQRTGSVAPAGVFLAPLYPDTKVLDQRYGRDAAPTIQPLFLYRPTGAIVEALTAQLDRDLGVKPSPVAHMCRMQKGGFNSMQSRDVFPAAMLDQYLELARQTIAQAANEIAAGGIVVSPLIEKRQLACGRCDFRPVCRFDRAYMKPRAAESVLPQLPDKEECEQRESDE